MADQFYPGHYISIPTLYILETISSKYITVITVIP